MACMEHWCNECDWFTADNKSPVEWSRCPECAGRVMHHCDEQDDRPRPLEASAGEERTDCYEW